MPSRARVAGRTSTTPGSSAAAGKTSPTPPPGSRPSPGKRGTPGRGKSSARWPPSSRASPIAFRPTWRVRPGGERILTGGITIPLETLRNGWGDCDSKSLLFASLLAAAGERDVVFFEGNKHLFVGLRLPPRRYDFVVRLRGIPYVLVEATDAWPIGRVPVKVQSGLRRGLYRVIRMSGPGGA